MKSWLVEVMSRLQENTADPLLDRLGRAFTSKGFELALVGGPVRDAMLGRPSADLDFTTNARPDDIEQILRPLARGLWDAGRRFGTIAAQVGNVRVEVTTYRSDTYDHRSRKPEVVFGDSLEGDLHRRDFTVNAMALRLPGRILVDPHSGVRDLLEGRLRTPSPAEESFADDPLRMMRAARFVSQLGFAPDPDVTAACLSMAEDLRIVSAERIHSELSKLLLGAHPERGLDMLVATGLAAVMLPELPALRLEMDEHHHHKDVYQHTLTVLRQAIDQEQEGPDLVLRLAAVLHDIGKPKTRRFMPDGSVTFHHHDVVGAKLARRRLTALRYDADTVQAVSRLIELHLRFFGYADSAWTDSAVRRYVRDAGPLLPRLHKLVRADVTTRNQAKARRLRLAYDDIERRIGELAEQEELASIRPDLNGDQIMSVLGIAPGPLVGRAYSFLLEARLDEGPLGEDEAVRRLKAWYANESAGDGDQTAGA